MKIIVSCVLMVLLPLSILFSCGEDDDDTGGSDTSTSSSGDNNGGNRLKLSACTSIEKCQKNSNNCCENDRECKSDCDNLENDSDCKRLPLDIATGDLQPVLGFLRNFNEDKGDDLVEENYNALCGWIKGFGKEEVFTEEIEGPSDAKKFLTWFASHNGEGKARPGQLFNSIQKDDAKKIVRLAFGELGSSVAGSSPTDSDVVAGVKVDVDDGDNFFELAVKEYDLDDDGSDQDGEDFFTLLHDLVVDPICDEESNQPEVANAKSQKEDYRKEACYLAFYCLVFPESNGQQSRKKVAALDLGEYSDVEEFIRGERTDGGLRGTGGLRARERADAAEKWNNKACTALFNLYEDPVSGPVWSLDGVN